VPANTSFSSAGSTAGWSCANGSPAGTPCTLTIGTLAAGASGSATFAIQVVTPFPANVSQLANAALAQDGSGRSASGSTTTPVSTTPGLSLSKSDGSTSTTPGAVVIYTLSYQNTGNVNLSAVQLSEIVPTNTTFNAANSTTGWSCANGSPAGTSCSFSIGSLAGGASGSVAFAVKVDNPFSNGATQLDNTADIADTGSSTSANGSDSTPVTAAPVLSADKTVADLNGGSVQPGDVLEYQIVVRNTGNQAATNVTVNDLIPANTAYVASSTILNGSPLADVAGQMPYANGGLVNSPGEPNGQVNAGEAATLIFHVKIDNPLPPNTTQITNQGTVSATSVTATQTNNPGTTQPGDPTVLAINNPTAIVLTSFTAQAIDGAIQVHWETAAEHNTWGFYLYRSDDEARDHAERVTPELILARGRSQGATYDWTDSNIVSGAAYTYWLQEVELDGTINEYGPARASTGPSGAGRQLFIPIVRR
jgi:uncharacterized repeat protein (TIGR01451 family)